MTGESMSMLGEAVDTGRPLYIFDVGDGAARWWSLPHNFRYKPLSHHFAMRFGPVRMRRDVGNIQNALVVSGRAKWLASDMIAQASLSLRARMSSVPVAPAPATAEEELRRTAQAVRRLVAPMQ